MTRHFSVTPNRLWMSLFGFWGLFLSGVGSGITGSPGVMQELRLQSLLDTKHAEVRKLRDDVSNIENDSQRLDKSKVAMEREIRRTLGYLAPDEILFDFTAAERMKTLEN